MSLTRRMYNLYTYVGEVYYRNLLFCSPVFNEVFNLTRQELG
jgi:hypothetical protein